MPAATPYASVVIPVRDGVSTIGAQLDALSRQDYTGRWEVVVADNGSTDGTQALVAEWSQRLPQLRLVDASGRPGAAAARNAGARQARGDVLVFCDADDVVCPGWLTAMTAATRQADVVGGAIDSHALNDADALRWRPPLPDSSLPISHGFLPYALTASVAFRADVFHQLGGFREDYPAGEDVELLWRAQLAQLRVAFAADAVVQYRYRGGLGPLLRQYLLYGTIGPRLYRDFGVAGMPGSRVRDVVGPWARLLARLPLALLSPARHGDVLRRIAFRVGRIRGSLAARVVYL